MAIEYIPVTSTGRTYNVKDSLNSIQHFNLQMSDIFGNLIEFIEPYELELAVFFTPPEAIMSSFWIIIRVKFL